jgi:hypothetical protein
MMLYTVYLLSVQEYTDHFPKPVSVFADEDDANRYAQQKMLNGALYACVTEIDFLGNPP